MEKIKLYQITDGPLELIPYRPPIEAKNELEYRYMLAIYLHEIGVCESCLFERGFFVDKYLSIDDIKIPRLMILYLSMCDLVEREEFYNYLDYYPLSPTCRYLAYCEYSAQDYIVSRFKSGKFTIDSLVEMVKVYAMEEVIGHILNQIAEYVLSNNGGDVAEIIRLRSNIENVDHNVTNLEVPIARYGNYDAFKYIISLLETTIYYILHYAYRISKERLNIVIGYYLKDGKSVEYLLINIRLARIYTSYAPVVSINNRNMVIHIIEYYQPNLEVVLRDAEDPFVVKLIETLIKNNV